MNIAGIGIDIIDIERVENAIEKRGEPFLKKVFTERELKYFGEKKAYYMHMAGKFAAKEAVKKALPDGIEIGLNWFEIEILNGEDGKPYVSFYGKARELMDKFNLSDVLVSISHTRTIATANAMAVKNGT